MTTRVPFTVEDHFQELKTDLPHYPDSELMKLAKHEHKTWAAYREYLDHETAGNVYSARTCYLRYTKHEDKTVKMLEDLGRRYPG
jgi:hypothetical protein